MNPIEDLKAEHRGIETALRILKRIAAEIEKPGAVEDAEAMVEFFKGFADTCHHAKEEEFLFPVLEEIGVSRNGGPIGLMLAEHEQGRRYVRDMQAALGTLKAGKEDAVVGLRDAAAGYIDLLRRHIRKEDEVLFEIAAERLSKARLTRLAEAFDRLEQERIGPGRHDAYHEMLAELGRKYALSIDLGQ
jgi:hemerythrin-like domain-containing protein